MLRGFKRLLRRLDGLKDQPGPPFELEDAIILETRKLASALCQARFVLDYPPEEWGPDVFPHHNWHPGAFSHFRDVARSRILDPGFTIDHVDSALDAIAQEVAWADDFVEFFFNLRPPADAPEDELLFEIARLGGKEHVLREITLRQYPDRSWSVLESSED